MNPPELTGLARELRLAEDDRRDLRLAFGIACVQRVEHLLTDDDVIACLAMGKSCLRGDAGADALRDAAARAAELASRHPGSGAIDGSGNAAVSTSFGVAAALAGRALVAAEYAAYAAVYSYAAYAVTDLASYAEEHAWQIETLTALARAHGLPTPAPPEAGAAPDG